MGPYRKRCAPDGRPLSRVRPFARGCATRSVARREARKRRASERPHVGCCGELCRPCHVHDLSPPPQSRDIPLTRLKQVRVVFSRSHLLIGRRRSGRAARSQPPRCEPLLRWWIDIGYQPVRTSGPAACMRVPTVLDMGPEVFVARGLTLQP